MPPTTGWYSSSAGPGHPRTGSGTSTRSTWTRPTACCRCGERRFCTWPSSPRPSTPLRGKPTRLTPGLPLLKEVAVAGDFEGVLSFGVGLARPAGLRVQTLTAPARVVIDFWYHPSRQPLWPVTTVDQAWQLQRAVDAGHQPWLCRAESTVTAYAEAKLRWHQPVVRVLSPTVYQVSDPATHATAVVTVYQPARTGGPCGIWVIAAVAR